MYGLHGRNSELGKLHEAWANALSGRLSFVRISGDPGVGKTRLVQEFYRLLAAQSSRGEGAAAYWPPLSAGNQRLDSLRPAPAPDGIPAVPLPYFWWALQCTRGNENNPESFAPYADAIEQVNAHLDAILLAKFVDQSLIDEARRIVTGGLATGATGQVQDIAAAMRSVHRLVQAQKETGQLTGRLADGVSQAGDGQKLEDVIIRLISALNDPAGLELPGIPVVLVIDDAQWADARSLTFTQRIMELGAERGWAILCIMLARSGEQGEQHGRLIEPSTRLVSTSAELESALLRKLNQQSVESIELEENLPHEAMRGILVDHLPGANAAAITALLEHVGGHPFYAVNFAGLVQESGWLDKLGNLAVTAAEFNSVPRGLHELIDRRLRLLGEGRLAVLQWGSVQGIRFMDELVDRVSEEIAIKRPEALDWLAELRDIHQLVGRELELSQLSFYTYSHRTVFERVQASFTESNADYGVVRRCLAELLRENMECGELADWPLEERKEALRTLCTINAESMEEALPHDLSTMQHTRLSALRQLYVITPRGSGEELTVLPALLEALDLADHSFEAHQICFELADACLDFGRIADSLLFVERGEFYYSTAHKSNNQLPRESPALSVVKARHALHEGLTLESRRMLDELLAHPGLNAYLELDPILEAKLFNSYGNLCKRLAEYDLSLQCYETAARIYALQLPSSLGTVYHNKGVLHIDTGNYGEAESALQRSLELSQTYGDTRTGLQTLNSLGNLHKDRGNLREALDHYQMAQDLAALIGDRRTLGQVLNNKANLLRQRSTDYTECLNLYRQSGEISLEMNDAFSLAIDFLNISGIFVNQQNYDEAEFHLAKALAYVQQINAPRLQGTIESALGYLYLCIADYEVSATYLNAAADTFEMIGMSVQLGLNQCYLALRHLRNGSTDRATDFIAKAENCKRQLEAGDETNLGQAISQARVELQETYAKSKLLELSG